mgnify:CR=1 FL=1
MYQVFYGCLDNLTKKERKKKKEGKKKERKKAKAPTKEKAKVQKEKEKEVHGSKLNFLTHATIATRNIGTHTLHAPTGSKACKSTMTK